MKIKKLIFFIFGITLFLRIIVAAEGGKQGILRFPSFITFPHNKDATKEIIDLDTIEDSISLRTIHDEIKEQFRNSKACIIARLITRAGNNIKISYFNAENINKWWFKGRLYPEDNHEYPDFTIHPENRVQCRGEVPYFISYRSNDNSYDFSYIGSTRDFNDKGMNNNFLSALLEVNYGDDMQPQYDNACVFLHEVYTGRKNVPDIKKNSFLALFYKDKMKVKQEDLIHDNDVNCDDGNLSNACSIQ